MHVDVDIELPGDLEDAERNARQFAAGASGPQLVELARVFEGLSSGWAAEGDAQRARNAARAGLELARASGQIELSERLEGRIQNLQNELQ